MRAAVLFFLSLSFLLLNGSDYGNAVAHHNRTGDLSQNIPKAQKINLENFQDFALTKTTILNEEKVYLINVEDEDEDLVSARKYVSLANVITLASIYLLFYFYNYFKSRLPFCHHLSYIFSDKYILQRALRI